jgi:methyl-accepting chemotaxis protein
VEKVNDSFRNISANTSDVLKHSQGVETGAAELGKMLDEMMGNAEAISQSVESTSAAMEEISHISLWMFRLNKKR